MKASGVLDARGGGWFDRTLLGHSAELGNAALLQ